MDKYLKKIENFMNESKTDHESKHILRDDICIKFIKDISSNKLFNDEIIEIAKKINNKVLKDNTYHVWYA